LLLTLTAFAQEKYVFTSGLPDMTVADLVKHTDSIFTPTTQFAFNCNTNYMLPYDKITKDKGSEPGYLEEQLKLVEKDSLQPVPYANIALYYENKGEETASQQYYKKAFDKIKYLKPGKDSASIYSYQSYLKFHLGQDGVPDMEKALSINKNDSLAVYFYPMFLLKNQRYDDAKKVLVNTLEDSNNKYYGYLMMYMAHAFENLGKLMQSESDVAKAFAGVDVETFVDMRPYHKYFKKNDEDFELMREMSELLVVTLKTIAKLEDKNYKPTAAELALIDKKEAFFKKRLKKKDANLFGLYMSLGTTSIAKRDFSASAGYFQKAADSFPKDKESVMFNRVETYDNMVIIHSYLKDYDKAIAVLKTAAEVPAITDAKKAETLVCIGKMYYLKNDVDSATEYTNKSIEVKETFEGDMFLGYLYVRQDLNSLGQRYIEKSQKLSATVENLEHLIIYYMILQIANGHFDEAVNVYEGNKEALAGTCKSCEYLINHYLVKKG
ncbi:MAG: hypothetical protein V4581_11020, partial [Bacteroidota bacterium]